MKSNFFPNTKPQRRKGAQRKKDLESSSLWVLELEKI